MKKNNPKFFYASKFQKFTKVPPTWYQNLSSSLSRRTHSHTLSLSLSLSLQGSTTQALFTLASPPSFQLSRTAISAAKLFGTTRKFQRSSNSEIGRLARLGGRTDQIVSHGCYSAMVEAQTFNQRTANSEDKWNSKAPSHHVEKNVGDIDKYRISSNIAKKDKADFLVKTLLDLENSKEVVYGTLDAWVAWEENFPIALLKRALLILEKEQEWHRVVQVIKWMLSKGQGTTMGTYGQLILALDMDNRPEEAHEIWDNKIDGYYHSVPWQLCRQMIAIYYRNNMWDKLTRLFEELEAYDRKPPEKSIVLRVANAYEALGRLKDKERILEKYNYLLTKDKSPKKPRKHGLKKKK